MNLFISPHTRRLIDLALDEDHLALDATSQAFFEGQEIEAYFLAKQPLVVAGLVLVPAVFERVDPRVTIAMQVVDGQRVERGTIIGELRGDAASLLRGERTALNFLQRMCGIATKTARYVEALNNEQIRLADTRKTLPGFRELDKYAVRCGGGANHRFSLSGGVMVKDNHITAAGGVAEAVARVRRIAPHTLKVEVEVANLTQTQQAVEAGADIIMFDNMTTEAMRDASAFVRQAAPHVLLEVSGNVTIERLAELGTLDVDVVSTGAITHSIEAADISMKLRGRA